MCEPISIGAAVGAGIGAIGGMMSGGGDKIWQGALMGGAMGAVGGYAFGPSGALTETAAQDAAFALEMGYTPAEAASMAGISESAAQSIASTMATGGVSASTAASMAAQSGQFAGLPGAGFGAELLGGSSATGLGGIAKYAPTAVGLGSSALQYMQIQEQNDYAAQIASSANQAATADYAAINTQEQQIDAKYTTDEFERLRQGMRERALLRTSAAESGIGGTTVDRNQFNSKVQQGLDISTLESNKQDAIAQAEAEKKKVYAQNVSRNNQAAALYSNPMSTAFKTGMSGATSYLTTSSALSRMKVR